MKKELNARIEESSITEHPEFNVKRNDWGVRHAYWIDASYDLDGNEISPAEFVPEDRSKYRPDLDGMAMADMWDNEKGDWRITPPGMEGITTFLRPKLVWIDHAQG